MTRTHQDDNTGSKGDIDGSGSLENSTEAGSEVGSLEGGVDYFVDEGQRTISDFRGSSREVTGGSSTVVCNDIKESNEGNTSIHDAPIPGTSEPPSSLVAVAQNIPVGSNQEQHMRKPSTTDNTENHPTTDFWSLNESSGNVESRQHVQGNHNKNYDEYAQTTRRLNSSTRGHVEESDELIEAQRSGSESPPLVSAAMKPKPDTCEAIPAHENATTSDCPSYRSPASDGDARTQLPVTKSSPSEQKDQSTFVGREMPSMSRRKRRKHADFDCKPNVADSDVTNDDDTSSSHVHLTQEALPAQSPSLESATTTNGKERRASPGIADPGSSTPRLSPSQRATEPTTNKIVGPTYKQTQRRKPGITSSSSSSRNIETTHDICDSLVRRVQSAPPQEMSSERQLSFPSIESSTNSCDSIGSQSLEECSLNDVSTGDGSVRQKRHRRRRHGNAVMPGDDFVNPPGLIRKASATQNQSDCTSSSDESFDDDDILGELHNDLLASPALDPPPASSLDHQPDEGITPGAFHTQGRALGAYPVWGRPETTVGPPTRLHNNSSRSSTRRSSVIRSSLSSGQSSVNRSLTASPGTRRQRVLGRISNRWRSSLFNRQSIAMVVEARLVAEGRPTPISVEDVTTVVSPDKVVTEEAVVHERRRFWIISLLIALGLVALILGLILKLATDDKEIGDSDIFDAPNDMINSRDAPRQSFPTDNSIDKDLLCAYGEDDRFSQSPVVQCLCTGKLETIHSSRIVLFKNYTRRLELMGIFDDTYEHPDEVTCNPRSVALYWLAETEANVYRHSNQNLVNSFSLVVLFAELGGMQWTEKHLWLTDAPVCDWGGISCHKTVSNSTYTKDGAIRELDLSSLGLVGTMPEVGLQNMEFLEVLNLSGNSKLGGSVPATLDSLQHLRVLDLRATSVDIMASISDHNGTFSASWCSERPNFSAHVSCGMKCNCCREDCSK